MTQVPKVGIITDESVPFRSTLDIAAQNRKGGAVLVDEGIEDADADGLADSYQGDEDGASIADDGTVRACIAVGGGRGRGASGTPPPPNAPPFEAEEATQL